VTERNIQGPSGRVSLAGELDELTHPHALLDRVGLPGRPHGAHTDPLVPLLDQAGEASDGGELVFGFDVLGGHAHNNTHPSRSIPTEATPCP